jgi:6-phosphofructokinase 2
VAAIATLTMNPAVDISTTVDKVESTQKLRCGPVLRHAGGGGINVARVLRRLGLDVVAIYPVGGGTGQTLERLVKREDIASVTVPVASETRESFTVIEESTDNEFRFVLPGPPLGDLESRACLSALGAMSKLGYVVLSGSLPVATPDDFYARASAVARRLGAKVVLDTSGPALKEALKAGVYIVKPNIRELGEYTGAPIDTDAQQIDACRALVNSGGAEIVALTLGPRGAIVVTADTVLEAEPVPVTVRSSVGAGDSFLAGLVARLAEGADIETAFRTAVAAGTAALLSPGTALAHRPDVDRITPRVVVRRA